MDFFEQLVNTEFHIDKIKKSGLPVIIYGSGNGAQKLITQLGLYGIKTDGVFVSDGFSTGKIFMGHKVVHRSDICEQFSDFFTLVGFATDIPELLGNIYSLYNKSRGKFLMPEVPVFGDGFFTKELLLSREEDIRKVYSLLSDEQSKRVFLSVIKFKISGELSFLSDIETDREEVFRDIFAFGNNERYLDLGAYDGDTVKEFLRYANGKVLAVEPAPNNFRKLGEYASDKDNVEILNKAVCEKNGEGFMSDKSGRSPELNNDFGKIKVGTVTVDSLQFAPTYIKYDVEGAEREAIIGSRKTIENHHPKMSISLYHRLTDIIDIPLLIHTIAPEYDMYIRKHPYLPAWETNLYVK